MSKPYHLSDFIDDLRAIYNEHGHIPVLTGKEHDLHADGLRVIEIDDWANSTLGPEPGDETPGVGHAVAIGPRY